MTSTARQAPDRLTCDVLVLGAGLAGLRAAWAARQAAPRLRVVIATPRPGPSGSSFANRNNALGMQAPGCFPDSPPGSPPEDDPQRFVDEVLALAAPGLALRPLVEALAQDAPARLRDLLDLPRTGLGFRRDGSGQLLRYPGCFSAVPRAVVFDGLARAHKAFLGRALALGAELLPGFEALRLETRQGRACGATLRHVRTGQALTLRAGAVIAALGGPAPLFARRTCGPGGTGLSYGLLAQAGARLVNAPYLQFFWVVPDTLEFVNPGGLAWPGLPVGLATELAAARLGHCPTGHGLPDSALDAELLARCDAQGLVRADHPQRGPLTLTLAAHAGNGGALVDAQGRTTVPGLYACGECASGMHGANRLGGGMVLATQVFGARAGAAAAREAAQGQAPQLAPRTEEGDSGADIAGDRTGPAFLRWLRLGMQRALVRDGLPGSPGTPRRQRLADRLRALADAPDTPRRRRLLALSALAVLGETG